MPNNIPLNWCECKLVDTCDVYQPKTISTKELVEDGKYTVYGANGIIGRYNQYNHENSEILITCRGATCGTINKSKPFSWINGNAMVVHPFIKISSDFLFYYLNSVNFKPYISGSAQPQITRISLQPLSLPLPPLAEQERIVEKIEALFQDIDEGVERLKSAQAQIKQYRQSVLKSAFEGKLYKTTDWKETTLGKSILPKRKRVLPNRDNQENPFIGMDCIEPNSLALSKVYKYKEMKSSAFSFEKGDVLYGRMRSYLNKVYLAEFSGIASAEFIIFSSNSNLSSEYLKYLLHQQDFVKYATRNASGDRPRVKFETDLAMYKFLLPTLPEQQRIVKEIEKRFTVADELEKAVNEGLEKADKLKQSILKKAFEGKLVAQNPNDEPASILLERIKKENQSPTKGRKK